MSLYTRFVSGVLFPLHERLKRHSTISVFREMEKSQWLAPEEIEDAQLKRLRQFLGTIGRDVPYYRQLFADRQFNPERLTSVQDLQRLPLLGKTEIRANTDAMKSVAGGQLQRFNTGGSSGEPLIFYLGNERVSHDVAAKRRATRWWGVDIGDPEVVVWGSPIELTSQDRVRNIRDRLFRSRLISAFEMSDSNLDSFIESIADMRPAMLFGYPSSLALIAEHAQKSGRKLDELGIKVAFVTSERLYDYQRERIESVFGCPVANGYGGRDAGFIAHQCPEGSMHITAEDILVEIVDDEGRVLPMGERGEIVVTHLATSEFPFVRYRTGDVGVLSAERCNCGRGLPVLAEIDGRSTDFVTAADGTKLHGLSLIYVLRDLPGVQSFKIHQESLDSTTVKIVRGESFAVDNEADIRKQFKARLGEQVAVNIEYCDGIAAEASGKYRYVVSEV